MAQYKVPQNVDIEDKVIAGLTLRQFGFLMFAGATVLILRYVLVGSLKVLFIPLSLCAAGFGVALAFVKINDRPFEIFLISAGKTFLKPARRIWQKEVDITPQAPVVKEEKPEPKKNYGEIKSNLERLAMIVDTGGKATDTENRISNITPPQQAPEEVEKLHDVLEETEKPSNALEDLFVKAAKGVPKKKKEPTISSMASVPVDKNQFSYDKLGIKNENEAQEMIEHANQKTTEEQEKNKQ